MWPDKSPDTRRKVFSKYRKQLLDDGIISTLGENVTVTVTGDAMVTPLVTPQPENVTVTVTNPLSIERGDSDRRTGGKNEVPLQEQDGNGLKGRGSAADGEVGRTTVLPRGARGEAPASNNRGGDGDVRTGTEG
jgi:hypothetical protein